MIEYQTSSESLQRLDPTGYFWDVQIQRCCEKMWKTKVWTQMISLYELIRDYDISALSACEIFQKKK